MSGSLKLRNKGSVSTINNEDYLYLVKSNEVQGDGKTTIGDLKEAFGISNVPGYKLTGRKIYTTSGTWTKDAGVDAVFVQVQGGGGQGGSTNSSNPSTGGGGGGYSEKFITSGLGSSETVTVGSGGTTGGVSQDGQNGSASSFGSHCSGGGGFGGKNNAGNGVGAGGSGSNGDINFPGGDGQTGVTSTLNGGGGDSRLGTVSGGGIGGNGYNGKLYGGGGGGAGSGIAGAPGANGIVIVWEYTSGQEIAAPVVSSITGYKKLGTKVFTTSGTYVKSLGTDAINVKLVGGGGGGGGTSVASGNSAGGGGAGGYAESFITSGISSSETVVIGAGGAGGVGANSGTSGGTTSFGSHLSATGGGGGSAGAGAGGLGGSGSVLNGIGWTAKGQAGGGIGSNAQSTGSAGTNGGSSLLGGGGGGGTESILGSVGSNGGGGASGFTNLVTATNGASGGAGLVIVEEYALDVSGDNTITVSPSFSARQSSSSQSIPSNTLTKVVLDLEELDTNNWFDSSTDYRFTPQTPGLYIITGAIKATSVLTTGGTLGIYKNGSLVQEKPISSGSDSGSVIAVVEMNGTTDFIELFILSNSNSISLDNTNGRTNLYGTFTGRKDVTVGIISRRIIASNNTLDSNNDIDLSQGVFQFSDYTGRAELLPLTKQLDANFSVGNNQGMLDIGSKQADTWYGVFAIYNLLTGVADVIASTNNSPSLPGGFTKYKKILDIRTDGSGNIRQFTHFNNKVKFKNKVLNRTFASLGTTSRVLVNVTCPPNTLGLFSGIGNGASTSYANVSSVDETDAAATTDNSVVGGYFYNGFEVERLVGSNSQVAVRSNDSGYLISLNTIGWEYQD